MIQLIRGFKDILPGEVELWQNIEKTARSLFEDFGFKEIRLPILERTELFARSIGEDTDIVEKEMYTFPDRKGDLITLRPEATASVVRSYIQHKMYAKDPVQKFYTIGPMFRMERPQKGRFRQFYQINAEVFGIDSPFIDAQIIFLAVKLFSILEVTDAKVHINSLGCPKCRLKFKESLSAFLPSVTEKLCPDCLRRSKKNPLRVLDCKNSSCREAIIDAPAIIDYLCPECTQHFETVKYGLEKFKIPFVIDKRLVRGLDYYTRTTFEIQTGLLGAQNAVAGGGRYDSLVKALGGPDQPAIGFAIGIDRLAEITGLRNKDFTQKPDIYIAALGEKSLPLAFGWSCNFGLEGIRCEMDFSNRSLKSQMKRADRLKASHVLIVGNNELEEGAVILRNMTTKKQISIPIENIVEKVKAELKSYRLSDK
ncbi:MAG: histidine--tRNA ligase [Proteobacteria bacterium]|nr:histidine--tRNA ligase [Pseudomonadota bacterium]MBU4259594.1 histidine--tRNA ligase [Pseudomonadota bacterium]MBU4287879.1 histidine--tRNA ligase [Pseudomonadota bacterium]MBU4414094.1 histidine--tRNA ligase [Pseudomonadota bacterium]MCG2757571.1 histidine--tRNA ligase [Desulfobacteraceae bacterium]